MADPEWKKLPIIKPAGEPSWKKLPVVQPAPEPESIGAGSSALQGFGQGASFGFADELAGASAATGGGAFKGIASAMFKNPLGRSFLRRMKDAEGASDAELDSAVDDAIAETRYLTQGTNPAAVASPYEQARGQARREAKRAEEANPKAFLAGQIAGAIATPGPKGLGAGKLAGQGALYGGFSGLGSSEGDLTKGEFAPVLADTALGAGTGAILTPVASGLSARFGRFLKGKSQENALKAVGARAGISDVLGTRGIKTAEDARRLGQVAIDKQLVGPFSKAADVAENTGFALEREGARIEGVLKDADAAALKSGNTFDFDAAGWRAAQEVMGPDGLTTEAMSKAGPAAGIVDRMLKQGEVDSSFAAANRLKSDIYDGISYGVDPALSTRMQQDAARGLKRSIEDQVEGRLGAEAVDELRAANRSYGDLRTIAGLAGDAARRQMGQVGALSPGTVAASIAAGNPAPMVMKAASPYIPSTMSWLQRTAAPQVFPLAQTALKPGVQELTDEEQNSIRAFLKGG